MVVKPIELKANAVNALLPLFLKQLFVNILFLLPVIGIYLLLRFVIDFDYDAEFIFGFSVLVLLWSTVKIIKDITKVIFTTYLIYPHHIEVRYSFIHQESHSVQYKQITDLEVVRNFWDRLCNVGDIRIHTANDNYTTDKISLALENLKNPEGIKNRLNQWIHQSQHVRR